MTTKILASMALAAGALAAQTGITNASVSGVVKDRVTGKPLANYTVSTSMNVTWVGDTVVQSKATKDVSSTTDSSGVYKLADLPPGSYRVFVTGPQRGGGNLSRRVAVNGTDVDNIDFLVTQDGTISGKVLDENKEPVPDVQVRLVSHEYYLGSLGYHYTFPAAHTNDQGEYTLPHVQPGQSYLLMVEKIDRTLPAWSETPLDPKLRKRVPVRSWYPNSPSRDGAQTLVLQPAEKRENVDIEMKKSASYCVEGTATGGAGTAVRFSIEGTQPSSGTSNGGGVFMAAPGGMTGPDGKFRICDLYPGSYRLSANEASSDPQSLPTFGVTDITITDEDLKGVRVTALPGKSMEVETVWDVDPPATPMTNKVTLSTQPLFRAGFMNEHGAARLDVPGTGSLDNIFPDDYSVRAMILAPGIYVKDVTFAGRSVLYEPLRAGAAMSGSGMRAVVAHDGATVNVQVNDKDGHPGANLRVLVMPGEVKSEGELASRLVQGETNQLGAYTSQTLPPGKYYVVATEEPVEFTPESIDKLWRARTRFQDVQLPPSGSATVKLEPGKIE